MKAPTKEELESLSDTELLDLLDSVSEEVRRRNRSMPRSAGSAAVDVMKTLAEIAARR